MVTRSSTKFNDKSLGRYRKLIQTKAKSLGHIENNCKLYVVTKPDSCYSPPPPRPRVFVFLHRRPKIENMTGRA